MSKSKYKKCARFRNRSYRNICVHSHFKIVKYWCSTRLLLQKRGFLHFFFWKKNLWTLFVLHILNKGIKITFLSSSGFFINWWNVDAFKEFDISACWIIQKQLPRGILQKLLFKFRYFPRKIFMSGSLF